MEEFDLLERRWVSEKNLDRKNQLLQDVFDAEVQYAQSYGIYDDLVTGNRTVESVSKRKTHNRQQTRRKQERCIGLPVKGRASKRMKKKKKPRCRIDVESGQILDWENFCIENVDLSLSNLTRRWRNHPRVTRPAKSRRCNDETDDSSHRVIPNDGRRIH